MNLVRKRRRGRLTPLVAWGVFLLLLGGCSGILLTDNGLKEFRLDSGQIYGARFKLAVPPAWQGDLVVIAPGWRPRNAPLVADLDPADSFVKRLLAEGWLVVTSSYRRNGLNVADAQEDLQRLIAEVVRRHGPCRRIIVEGSSMGANIALLMAEQQDPPHPATRRGYAISGVVALGAAPQAVGESSPLNWSHAPRLPVLLLSNRSEIGPVLEYARLTRRAHPQPAVWVLERPGHVNLNVEERLAAVLAVADWVAVGTRPPGTAALPFDATVDRSGRPSTAVAEPNLRQGHIVKVDVIYGNLETDLVAADLWDLGIRPGSWVQVTCGTVTRRALWGTTYGDVAAGEMVIFETASGRLRVAVNEGRAARRLRCQAGETLALSRKVEKLPFGINL